MKVFILILALVSGCFACPQVITPVSGLVLRRVGPSVYKPISGAKVTITNSQNSYIAITDQAGAYAIELGGCFGPAVIHVTRRPFRFRPQTFTTSSLTVDGIIIPIYSDHRTK